jgi:hypothetical protein
MTYLLINGCGCRYLILVGACRVPDLLHYRHCLLGRHIPRVDSLTDKGHICCNKCTSEPQRVDPGWKLFTPYFFTTFGNRGSADDNDILIAKS